MYGDVFLLETGSPDIFLVYSSKAMLLFATNVCGVEALKELQVGKESNRARVMAETIGRHYGIADTPIIDEFDTANLTICPTFRCQLRCNYCFAWGGDRLIDLDLASARLAVDFVLGRSEGRSPKFSNLTWHGGGEPTLSFSLMKEVTCYHKDCADRLGIKPQTSIVSNGIWSEEVTHWILESIRNITISCDGPADIQDFQRPLRNGEGSSSLVFETLRKLKYSGIKPDIRVTVTSRNVSRMPETIQFFHDLCDPKVVQFEPVSVCGRCEESATEDVDPAVFIQGFKEAYKTAQILGIKLNCAGVHINRRTRRFCGAPGRTICVMPNGLLTTCHRVDNLSNPLASEFVFGSCAGAELVWNSDQLENVNRRLGVERFDWCKDCFCKYTCGGGCAAARFAETGTLYGAPSRGRCDIIKELTRFRLLEEAKSRGLFDPLTKRS